MTSQLSPTDAYLQMATIRSFELRCQELSVEGLIDGSIHLCAGQEAIPVGAMSALAEQDRVVATYRGHGWAIACGVPLAELLGEICQRSGGTNGGRGGSAHLSAPKFRLYGENSIVGAGVPIAAGLALASKVRADNGVAVVSIGDGAMNQGATHEGLAFAAAQRLPLIVICENNGWSEMTPISVTVRGSIAARAASYGMNAHEVDGGDPEAVRLAVSAAADRARAGDGPVFLEGTTVRLMGHYNRDIEHYRPEQDKRAAEQRDPLVQARRRLESVGVSSQTLDALEKQAQDAVDATTVTVRAMPEPNPADARSHLYATPGTWEHAAVGGGSIVELTYQRAANRALSTELTNRSEVVVYGEDVGHAGGIFGVTRGLQKAFGPERVFDTPIAESAILGSAVGAAMAGMRPVVEIMWGDFLLVALDQIVNQAANVRYLNRGQLHAPMVIRTQQGVTPGSCAQHSQSLEALLAHIPGVKVGLPATADDAYAMLRAAIADEDPCILFEARSLYQVKGQVSVDGPVEPAAGAKLRRGGRDVGIVTWGTMVAPALEAAEMLAEQGIDAGVLDLRWLQPLDMDQIASLVRACGRIVVAHEANTTGGFGAEIAARVQERHFHELKGPVVRLGAADTRIPAAPALQKVLIPNASVIAKSCVELVHRTG